VRLFDYDRLSALMREARIDVLLAHTEPNVEYLTDFEWMAGYHDHTTITEDGKSYAAGFVCLPRDEATGACLVAPAGQTGYPENSGCWITDVRYWGPVFHVTGQEQQMAVRDDPVSVVVEALREKGLDRGRVGVEYRSIELTYAEQLREQLPNTTLVDGEPILWELRMRKSEEEIARSRRAAEIVSEVFNLAYATAEEGMPEWHMLHRTNAELMRRKAYPHFFDIGFGPKGAHYVGPSDTRLKKGDIFRLDLAASYKGYLADMSRSLACAGGGPVSDEAKRAHAAIYGVNRALREAVRPGALPSDLFRMAMRMLDEAGYASLTPQAGHSIGRTAHEPPFLVEGNDVPLEPGMLVVVEPTIRVQGAGSFNIEDMTLVTEDGCEVLTSTPRELDAFL